MRALVASGQAERTLLLVVTGGERRQGRTNRDPHEPSLAAHKCRPHNYSANIAGDVSCSVAVIKSIFSFAGSFIEPSRDTGHLGVSLLINKKATF